MDDLISNRAAVDALERIFDRCEEIEAHLPDGDPDKTGYKMFPDYITVWKYLHQLSSVERFSQKEKLKMRVESEDLFPDLPQIIKDKNTEIIKAYKEGYEQGEKDAERQEQITSEMDEIFRIASEIRLAVGCNTSHECWELAQRGDIQRVKHGRWIHRPVEEWGASNCKCSICGAEYFFPLLLKGGADNYCGNCGAKMEK